MTTATAVRPTAELPSAELLQEGFAPIGSIKVLSNIRKTFNEAALKELAENIKSLGIISPLIVRPGAKDGEYLLVAGERRYRAAKSVGLAQVPVRVLKLDEARALEYQAAENIHRKDLTPIEEARAFKALLDARKYNVEQLAQLVDKSKVYVYRAVSLLELPKDAISKIEAGEWTPAHGHQLLRVPADKREELMKDWLDDQYDGDTAQAFAEYINHQVGKTLSQAAFPKDRPYADKPACTTCPLNTGNQGMLFDGAEKGKCTGPDCFEAKSEFYKKEQFDKAAATAKKLGLQWLGEGQGQGYGEDRTFKGMRILSDAEAKKAKDSKKYAAGWMLPDKYSSEKARMVVVRLKTEEEKKAAAEERVKTQRNDPDSERARFIEKAGMKAEVEQIFTKKPKMTDEVLKELVILAFDNYTYSHNGHDELMEFFGAKDGDELREKKVTRQQLEAMAVAVTREWDDLVPLLKLDSKTARKAAAAEWDKKAAETTQAARKAKK